MKFLGYGCNCRFCREYHGGRQLVTWPCGVVVTDWADHNQLCGRKHDKVLSDGREYPLDRTFTTGGRWRRVYYLEPGEYRIWLHAKNAARFRAGEYRLPSGVELVAAIPTSVHGCEKIRKSQLVLVLREVSNEKL